MVKCSMKSIYMVVGYDVSMSHVFWCIWDFWLDECKLGEGCIVHSLLIISSDFFSLFSVIFTNNFAFGPKLNHELKLRFAANVRDGKCYPGNNGHVTDHTHKCTLFVA